jgi:hypothetical protein
MVGTGTVQVLCAEQGTRLGSAGPPSKSLHHSRRLPELGSLIYPFREPSDPRRAEGKWVRYGA